jgi:ankyrin repeat protein
MKNRAGFNSLSIDELNEQLTEACKVGCLDTIKYLLESKELNQHPNYFNYHGYDSSLSKLIMEVTNNGDLDILQYLFTETPIKESNALQMYLNHSLHIACLTDKIDIVKFVLTSTILQTHAQINSNSSQALVYAYQKRNFPLMDYLLTDSQLMEKSFIPIQVWIKTDDNDLDLVKYLLKNTRTPYLSESVDDLFVHACKNGYLEMTKFLVESKELTENAKINSDNYKGFIKAIENKQSHILQYLIFDLNIRKTTELHKILSHETNFGKDRDFAQNVVNWLNLREVNKQLNTELIETNVNDIEQKKKVKL